MTIRQKLTLLYSGLLAIIIVVFGVVAFAVIRSAWISTVDSTLDETAVQVINNSRFSLVGEFSGPKRPVLWLPQLDIFRASGTFVQVWLLNDNRLTFAAASDNLGDYQEPLDPDDLNPDVREHYSNIFIDGLELRVLTRPIATTSGRPIGTVQVAASLQTVNNAIDKLLVVLLVGSGAALVGSFILGMWLSNEALRPLEQIIKAADSISTAKDLGTRLPWKGPMDELGHLTSVFNRMMDRLEALFSVQQRFVADVSHELRTPLTAIRGNLDLVKRYGMEAASLEAMESETERMSRLVNDLLLLARADYGGLTLDMTVVDLDTLVLDVFKQARVLCHNRDLQIKIDHLEPARIHGNSDRLKQLLINLVSNAIKFTPDGGQIHLHLQADGNEALLRVQDTGIGITPEDLPHIFDRFYQADSSRSRQQISDGSGLGLSIAQWIAEAHQGRLTVESVLGTGSIFCVRLPLDEDCADEPEDEQPTSNYRMAWQRLSKRKRAPAQENTPAE